MKPKAIHQFHYGSAYGDGVTNAMLFTQRLLREGGYNSEIYCAQVHPGLSDRLRHVEQYLDAEDQVLLVHYSLGNDRHQWIDELSARKILIYHNITPPQFLVNDSELHKFAVLGREQLAVWASTKVFAGAIGVSDFNSAELRSLGYPRVATIPLLVDLQWIRQHRWASSIGDRFAGARNLLFVGRLIPSKGQLDLVRMMAVLRSTCVRPVRLLLAGGAVSSHYTAAVKNEIERLGLSDLAVVLDHISNDELFALYRIADLYVSLSRHEGFGMPLVEAMNFDIPIVALAEAGVPSTLGEGGLLLKSIGPKAVAATAKLVLEEPWLRREIIEAQRRELERFDRSRVSRTLQTFLRDCDLEITLCQHAEQKIGETWRIEGPIDSSYSLAIVNRALITALSAQGVDVTFDSRDGDGPIAPSDQFLRGAPAFETMWRRRLVDPQPFVTLRNQYPPLVHDMKAVLRGLCCFAWEESGFPHEYVHGFNNDLALVTVTSRFVAKVLRDNGVSSPICVVGNGVDHVLQPDKRPAAMPSPITGEIREAFCFLHVSSCFPRKGIDALLKAWVLSFTQEDEVVLVIKTAPNPHHNIEAEIANCRALYPDHARIVLINEELDADAIVQLFTCAHVVVCPSRGEGFGLPMAEAFALGKPVVTTANGGQIDFCTTENSWLCDYDFGYARNHLNIPSSVWAEPRVESLVECLRAARSAPALERHRRGAAGQKTVLTNFTWRRVAERIQDAVAQARRLDTKALRLPRIGWVSTWNTRCGIASYSKSLLQAYPHKGIAVFADQTPDLLERDGMEVRRCWKQGWVDALDDLYEQVRSSAFDAIVIQFNFGFFNLLALARLIEKLTDDGIHVYLFLHSTADVEKPDITIRLSDAVASLARARRLLVHSVHDLNRLKKCGLVDNVTLFPHGLPEQSCSAQEEPDERSTPIIATFGFLLPHKGLRELVVAFDLVRRDFPDAKLLLLNALYPVEDSSRECALLKEKILELELQDSVELETGFLDENEILARLRQASLVVYPYQNTQESASGAVRLGLASLAPVAITPLPIFADVAGVCHGLPGCNPPALARGIIELLSNKAKRASTAAGQQKWVQSHSWKVLSQRLAGLIRGNLVDDLMAGDGI